jgi:hypothetical protein
MRPRCLLAAIALVLLVLFPVDAFAGGPCAEEEEEPTPIGRVTPLHKAGAELLKGLICEGGQRCLKKKGKRLEKAAYTVVDVCLAEPLVPKWMCLSFVANLGNESGGNEHPTCGGLSQRCAKDCDRIDASKARQGCYLDCARDKGIKVGGARWKRVKRCNDWGSSRGPFQQKGSSIRYCKRILKNPHYNPHSLLQSATCVIKKVKRSALKKKWPCRNRDSSDRWMIAMKRVGAGPLRTMVKATPKTWIPSPRTGEGKWVEAQPAIRTQRCELSKYAQWGRNRYRMCGKPCFKMLRPTVDELRPAPIKVGKEGNILGQGD